MDEFARSLLLVFCLIGAVIALIVAYLWYFIFGRSLRGVLMAGLSILLNRDSTVDLDDDVVLTKRPQDVKHEMTGEVSALDFDGSVSTQDEYIPQVNQNNKGDFGAQAVDGQSGKNELVSSSFGSGRFRRVADMIIRPFLMMRIAPKSNVQAENVKRDADPSDVE